jgi:multimeric flavodoxin WrbA
MTTILAINGSYRANGITDQAVEAATQAAKNAGAEVEIVLLRDYPIEFCVNCRKCCQAPGEEPGECALDDGMRELIKKIEQADAYILASPTNFGSVTALYQRFLERLIPYGYWSWKMNFPRNRKSKSKRKKALLISSSAAPGFMGRWMFQSRKQLKATAKIIGAARVGLLFTGMIAQEPHPQLPAKSKAKAEKLAKKLV